MHPWDYERLIREKFFKILNACEEPENPTGKVFEILNDWDCDIVAEWLKRNEGADR